MKLRARKDACFRDKKRLRRWSAHLREDSEKKKKWSRNLETERNVEIYGEKNEI